MNLFRTVTDVRLDSVLTSFRMHVLKPTHLLRQVDLGMVGMIHCTGASTKTMHRASTWVKPALPTRVLHIAMIHVNKLKKRKPRFVNGVLLNEAINFFIFLKLHEMSSCGRPQNPAECNHGIPGCDINLTIINNNLKQCYYHRHRHHHHHRHHRHRHHHHHYHHHHYYYYYYYYYLVSVCN